MESRGVSGEGRRWAEDRVWQFLKHLTWRENFIWGESVGTSFTNLLLKLHSLEAFKNIQKEQPFYNNLSETGSKRKLSGLSKTVPLSSFWRKTLWNTDSSIQTLDPNKRPHFFGKRHCVFVSNALGKLRNQLFFFLLSTGCSSSVNPLLPISLLYLLDGFLELRGPLQWLVTCQWPMELTNSRATAKM